MAKYVDISFFPLGEAAIVIKFGDRIHKDINSCVRSLSKFLMEHPIEGINEHVPAYTTVTIFYDIRLTTYSKMRDFLNQALLNIEMPPSNTENIIEIPVCYEEPFCPDLDYVAQFNGLTGEKVISFHTSSLYLVYMIGFAPGFPFLGGMPKEIATPRHESPRTSISSGSVGIAGNQTGVYPLATPGGWQIIGRTPLRLFDPTRNPPTLLHAGDHVKFVRISKSDYHILRGHIE